MKPNLPLGALAINPPTLKALNFKALGGFGKMGVCFAALRSACARMRINDHIKQSSHPPKTSHFFENRNGNMSLGHGRIFSGREDRDFVGRMPGAARVLPYPPPYTGRGDPKISLVRRPKTWVNTVNTVDIGLTRLTPKHRLGASMATLREIDLALAKLALWMRAQGEHGLAVLPIFERLEREREAMASLDARLDMAIARGQEIQHRGISDV